MQLQQLLAPPQKLKRLTRAEYEKIVATGVFDGQHLELVNGVIVERSPIGPDYAVSATRLGELFFPPLRGRATVRLQLP